LLIRHRRKNKNRKDGELKWQKRKPRKAEKRKEERRKNDSLLYSCCGGILIIRATEKLSTFGCN